MFKIWSSLQLVSEGHKGLNMLCQLTLLIGCVGSSMLGWAYIQFGLLMSLCLRCVFPRDAKGTVFDPLDVNLSLK